MPGILCQENYSKRCLGVYDKSESSLKEFTHSENVDTDMCVEHHRNFFDSSNFNSDQGGPSNFPPPQSLVCRSEGEQMNCSSNMNWDRRSSNVPAGAAALLHSKKMTLSRSDLLTERRMSLGPILIRSRSHSQPPESPHSAPADSSLHLAEAALHNALATCALPSIQISKDVSQGESNQEDERQSVSNIISPSSPASAQEDSHLDSKSSFTKSNKTSSFPPSPSPGIGSHYSSPSSPGDKETPEIPTDLSDTVESEPEKEKILGSVAELVVCPNIATHHLGREVTNVVYGLPIDTLFTLLFTNSKFMFDIYAGRKTYDVVISPWQSNSETNQKIRQVTYTLTLPTNSFGPKVSHVTETQVISAFSKPSEIYTIDAEASNSGIPYADSFYISNHWCLTRESSTETRLVLWSQVKYKKSVWGFMKNVIDKNAFSGMESLMSDLNSSLLREVDKTNLKRTKRRRRRAGSKGNDISDPLHVPSPIISNNDIHKATQIPSRKLTLPSIVRNSSSTVGGPSIKSITLFFLFALLLINAFLYYRLYSLEERVISSVSLKDYAIDTSILKFSGPKGDKILIEEWVQILRHQEVLHAEEVDRWKSVILEAANYLRKAEESLRNLHSSIPNKQATKLQNLLYRLQVLQEMQEEKRNSDPNSKSAKESPPTIARGEDSSKNFKSSQEEL